MRVNMSILNAYLDTSIISGLAKEDLKDNELEALLVILKQHKNGNVVLVTSPIAKEEIERIPESYRRKHEIIYNLLSDLSVAKEVQIYSGGMMGLGLGLGLGGGGRRIHLMYEELSALLPDKSDARHIFQAAMNNIQYFLTTDARTILSYREKISQIAKVEAVNPLEFMKICIEN